MQEPEPLAVAPIVGALDHGTIAEAHGLRINLLDLEAMVASAVVDAKCALALPQQLQITHRAIDFDAQRSRKRRGQRPATAPAPRMRMGDMEQERSKRGLGSDAL